MGTRAVNLPAKTEYACLAVLELAARYGAGEPIRIRSIADTHGIPSPFLVQILLQLKAAGLVESTRGAAGGYRLLRDPAAITLADVFAIVEGAATEPRSNVDQASGPSRVILDAWREATEAQRESLAAVTFADLLERARDRSEKMYYI